MTTYKNINQISFDNGETIYNLQGSNINVDSELSTSSENPVQNKVITNALNNFKYYNVVGEIAGSEDSNFIGIGQASIIIYPSRFVQINYSYRVTQNSATSSSYTFKYGLSVNKLRTLNNNIPIIIPYTGGTLYNFTTAGVYQFAQQGEYGGSHTSYQTENDNYWVPARACYNSTRGYIIGAFGTDHFPTNMLIHGTAFGHY